MNAVMIKSSEAANYAVSLDKYSALMAVSHFETQGDYDKVNKMLGIIARSIKEDQRNHFSTNFIKLVNPEETRLFAECPLIENKVGIDKY